jgi:hypothetical protein
MFSSTHLIRQSKQIFDKLQEKEIEKAVILRDGKPSFIMLDFDVYEKIMADYSNLQNKIPHQKQKKEQTKQQHTEQIIIQNIEQLSDKQQDSKISDNESKDISDFTISLSEDLDEQKSEIKEFWDK